MQSKVYIFDRKGEEELLPYFQVVNFQYLERVTERFGYFLPVLRLLWAQSPLLSRFISCRADNSASMWRNLFIYWNSTSSVDNFRKTRAAKKRLASSTMCRIGLPWTCMTSIYARAATMSTQKYKNFWDTNELLTLIWKQPYNCPSTRELYINCLLYELHWNRATTWDSSISWSEKLYGVLSKWIYLEMSRSCSDFSPFSFTVFKSC